MKKRSFLATLGALVGLGASSKASDTIKSPAPTEHDSNVKIMMRRGHVSIPLKESYSIQDLTECIRLINEQMRSIMATTPSNFQITDASIRAGFHPDADEGQAEFPVWVGMTAISHATLPNGTTLRDLEKNCSRIDGACSWGAKFSTSHGVTTITTI